VKHAALVALVLVLLTGCTGGAPDPVPTSYTASSAPQPVVDELQIPNGIVGTATLEPGGIALTITHDNGEFFLTGIPDPYPTDWYGVAFARQAAGEDNCFDDANPILLGLPWPSTVTVFEPSQVSGEPSYMHEVAIFGQPGQPCATPLVASSPITWTIPSQYPGLEVVDGGERDGAIGVVTLDGGVPRSYVVHQGDNLDGVVARFGLTTDEFHWLNPFRNSRTALDAGEELNLDPATRV